MGYIDEEIPATFTSHTSQKSTTGVVITRRYDEKERNRRMIKYGGGCFLAAIFSIFLPLIHFVLVPGFLIAAITMVVINSRPANIESAKAKCPQCGVDFVISKGKPVFPLEDVCASCHHKITINKT
jgi:hypothetical protein